MNYTILKILDGDIPFEEVEDSDDPTKANIRIQELMKKHPGEIYIVRVKGDSSDVPRSTL